jgi:hypothetical protein
MDGWRIQILLGQNGPCCRAGAIPQVVTDKGVRQ